jgi:plasmid maintenance system antidote protein VapI
MAKTNTARVARIAAAGEALYGKRWQSAMARSIDISKQMLSFILAGDRPLTDDVEEKVVAALGREIERLGKTATKLQEIQGRILAAREKLK